MTERTSAEILAEMQSMLPMPKAWESNRKYFLDCVRMSELQVELAEALVREAKR